jgi:acetyltransferase-like isoleucine patch superfamily enzyme
MLMRKILSLLLQIFGAFLPSGAKRHLYRLVLGWIIGEGAKIGFSIILCTKVRIGSNVRIGHFNIFRGLKILEIGNETKILNFNHFMARVEDAWPATFSIGSNSLVTSHHFFDCGGRVKIGNLCCVGGRDTQFWTHLLALRSDGKRQIDWRELAIADRC